jgi:hypothetical protein
MNANALEPERLKAAEVNLKAILETLAPYWPKPDPPSIPEPSRWFVTDKSDIEVAAVSQQKNALASLS